jgi:hypothetical protein
MATSSSADRVSLRSNGRIKIWGASRIFWFYTIMYLFYGVIGISLLVAGALEKNGTAPFVTGIVITTMLIPLYALLIGSVGRPLTIERGNLKLPKAFGHREISLKSLSGVGLVYRLAPRTPGWSLQLWGDDGKPIEIRRFTLTSMRNPELASGVTRRIGGVRDWSIPLPKENTGVLGLSKPGRVATTIFDSALASQGPGGPLLRLARQKAVIYDPNSLSKALAWWSPDGYMGRAIGLPPPDSAKLADPTQCNVAPMPNDAIVPLLSHAELFSDPIDSISQSSPTEVPLASPEVQNARKRNLRMTFASLPFFIAIAIAFSLLLGAQGHLASGGLCAAVLEPKPVHASTTCNMWRHHQLITFIWIGSLLALGLVAIIVFQIRATRNLLRTSKAASVSVHDAR